MKDKYKNDPIFEDLFSEEEIANVKPDIETCSGKLSALHFEVLKMNLQLDFIEDFSLARSLKENIKYMDELIESLQDDLWICDDLIHTNDEEDENDT